MKIINGDKQRSKHSETIIRSGEFAYRLDEEWGNLPEKFRYISFCSGCCDKDDNIYLICRDYNHPIILLDSEGNYIRDLGRGLFSFLHDIYITDRNTLLCVETQGHVIRELTATGELIRDFGEFGKSSNSGYDPYVWRRRQREGKLVPMNIDYDKHWALIESLNTITCAAPPFNLPTGIAINSKGELFCSDGYGNAAIHKIKADGTLIKTWGGPGNEPGKFLVPHCIMIDKCDRVWVGDREGNSVHVFSDEGELIGYIPPEYLFQPSDIWADDKNIYVGERGGITILNMEMNVVAQLGYFFSPLLIHGICGNSKSDLFLMTIGVPHTQNCLKKLTRI